MRTDTIAADPTPILTTIGDLRSPNWGDERDRVVHLEGAAVAQQAQMFIVLGIAAAMPWALGTAGTGWGTALIVATGAGTRCYARYIQARGVRGHSYFAPGERTRGLVLSAIAIVYLVGALWALSDGSTAYVDTIFSVLIGVVGVLVGVTVGVLIASVLKRPDDSTDIPDDVFDE